MAFKLADDVKDTTSITGTGSYILSGTPPASFRSFLAGIGNGNQTIYACRSGSDFELGLGTLSGGTTLSRDLILASTNADAAINWPTTAAKDIYVTTSGKLMVILSAVLQSGDANKLVKVKSTFDGFDLSTIEAMLPSRLQATLISVPITDWNDALSTGWYNANNAANAPTAGVWYMGDVVAHNNLWVTQTLHEFAADGDSDSRSWRRALNNGVWSSWSRLRLTQTEQTSLFVAKAGDALQGGYTATAVNDGTKSTGTYTPPPTGGNLRRIVNGGAFTLAAPVVAGDYTLVIQITNNASAGAITLTGFSKTSGDAFTTVNGDDFLVYITKLNGFTFASVVALQ